MYDGRTQGSPLHVLGTYVNEEFIFRAFLKQLLFLQENFNVWIGEKHKIIDVPFPPALYLVIIIRIVK
jgi:hypothetical protein